MKSSEYLWGKPKEEYEPEQSTLANKKIKDGKAMLKTLAGIRDQTPADELPALIERYTSVAKAVEHWQLLKEM